MRGNKEGAYFIRGQVIRVFFEKVAFRAETSWSWQGKSVDKQSSLCESAEVRRNQKVGVTSEQSVKCFWSPR